ncbi:hypothetical protein MBAV_000025, partial [Candidatus Magnetobacterium bavaricum]
MAKSNQQAVTLPHFEGINNKSDPAMLKPGELTECDNYLVGDVNMLISRPGYEVLEAGAAHSLWSDDNVCFYRKGTALCQVVRVNPFSSRIVRTGLN